MSSSAFFIEAAAKIVSGFFLRLRRPGDGARGHDDGKCDGGTNKKLEHSGAPCVADGWRASARRPGELVVFLDDRCRKRRSGGKGALTARRGSSCNLTGHPHQGNAACLCTLSRTGIARNARVRDIAGRGGAVLGIVERVRAIMMTPQAEWPRSRTNPAMPLRHPIRRHSRADPGAGAAHRRLADRRLHAVSVRADRRRRRLCLDLRCGLCGGAGGRSFWRQNSADSAAIPGRFA